jgi:probable phosphoglycerate mutase
VSAPARRGPAGAAAGLDTDVILIRHGQTTCTLQGRFCGRHEPPLNDTGRQMAAMLGDHPQVAAADLVVSSPAQRALGTAEALGRRRGGPPVVVDDRLAELSFGEWEDRLPAELTGPADRQALARWERDPALFAPPGGETGLEVSARVLAAVRDAGLRAPSVVIVTHKAPIRLALAFFLAIPTSRYRTIANVAVGSVTRIRLAGGAAVLTAIGDVSHLPRPWRTDPDRATGAAAPVGAAAPAGDSAGRGW